MTSLYPTGATVTPAVFRGQPITGGIVWLGAGVDYHEAWVLQQRLLEQRVAGAIADTLLLLEHAPVYTAGRRAPPEHVRGPLNAPLVETDRGGQVTYHGPGQLVGYGIVALAAHGMGPRAYVRALERALTATLARCGISAHTEDGLTGVWAGRGKIAAIGVRVSRGVTMHGFALNVDPDLRAFDPIVPCGIPDRPVTSMREVLGRPVPMADVRAAIALALTAPGDSRLVLG